MVDGSYAQRGNLAVETLRPGMRSVVALVLPRGHESDRGSLQKNRLACRFAGLPLDQLQSEADKTELDEVEDDRLRLIFTCCHPALSADARVALTLRAVCDLTTEEIARAFAAPATIAQRIVRAKARIRDAHIFYRVPECEELPARLDSVLRVIYLLINEAYSASVGPALTRADPRSECRRQPASKTEKPRSAVGALTKAASTYRARGSRDLAAKSRPRACASL